MRTIFFSIFLCFFSFLLSQVDDPEKQFAKGNLEEIAKKMIQKKHKEIEQIKTDFQKIIATESKLLINFFEKKLKNVENPKTIHKFFPLPSYIPESVTDIEFENSSWYIKREDHYYVHLQLNENIEDWYCIMADKFLVYLWHLENSSQSDKKDPHKIFAKDYYHDQVTYLTKDKDKRKAIYIYEKQETWKRGKVNLFKNSITKILTKSTLRSFLNWADREKMYIRGIGARKDFFGIDTTPKSKTKKHVPNSESFEKIYRKLKDYQVTNIDETIECLKEKVDDVDNLPEEEDKELKDLKRYLQEHLSKWKKAKIVYASPDKEEFIKFAESNNGYNIQKCSEYIKQLHLHQKKIDNNLYNACSENYKTLLGQISYFYDSNTPINTKFIDSLKDSLAELKKSYNSYMKYEYKTKNQEVLIMLDTAEKKMSLVKKLTSQKLEEFESINSQLQKLIKRLTLLNANDDEEILKRLKDEYDEIEYYVIDEKKKNKIQEIFESLKKEISIVVSFLEIKNSIDQMEVLIKERKWSLLKEYMEQVKNNDLYKEPATLENQVKHYELPDLNEKMKNVIHKITKLADKLYESRSKEELKKMTTLSGIVKLERAVNFVRYNLLQDGEHYYLESKDLEKIFFAEEKEYFLSNVFTNNLFLQFLNEENKDGNLPVPHSMNPSKKDGVYFSKFLEKWESKKIDDKVCFVTFDGVEKFKNWLNDKYGSSMKIPKDLKMKSDFRCWTWNDLDSKDKQFASPDLGIRFIIVKKKSQ